MSRTLPRPNRVPISPLDLAAALRNGLESRRTIDAPAVPSAPPSLPFESLRPFAGLLGHPAPPAHGPIRKGVRFLRRIVKRLMNPWLDHQTHFNHQLVDELQARFRFSPEVELHDFVHRLQDRINEQAHKLELLTTTRSAIRSPLTSDESLIDVFLQTRLPDPPGSALVLADIDTPTSSAVLASVGYAVLRATSTNLSSLPLKPMSFRVVTAWHTHLTAGVDVWESGEWATRAVLSELLSPGGRVFGSRNSNGESLSSDTIAKMCDPLRVVETYRQGGVTFWMAEG